MQAYSLWKNTPFSLYKNIKNSSFDVSSEKFCISIYFSANPVNVARNLLNKNIKLMHFSRFLNLKVKILLSKTSMKAAKNFKIVLTFVKEIQKCENKMLLTLI